MSLVAHQNGGALWGGEQSLMYIVFYVVVGWGFFGVGVLGVFGERAF